MDRDHPHGEHGWLRDEMDRTYERLRRATERSRRLIEEARTLRDLHVPHPPPAWQTVTSPRGDTTGEVRERPNRPHC